MKKNLNKINLKNYFEKDFERKLEPKCLLVHRGKHVTVLFCYM